MLDNSGVYGVSVGQTTPLGTRVANISCSDADSPPFASPSVAIIDLPIQFNLVRISEGEYTVELAQTPTIPLSEVLDVVCSDNEGLTDEGQLFLFVSNSQGPTFTRPSYQWALSEGVGPGEEFDELRAVSSDSSTLLYTFSQGNEDGVFYIEQEVGVVSLIRGLDYETRSTHPLVVQVTDGAGRSAEVLLTVQVFDENDELPLISPTGVLIARQNDPAGHPIGSLSCTDPDSSANVTFSFNPPSEIFSVDRFGVVRLETVLDDTPIYSLPVQCFDAEGSGDASSGILTVRVEFPNSHQPEFVFNTYTFSIPEDSDPLSSVGQVSAVDRDVGRFGQVSYEITHGNPEVFYIESSSGEIGLLSSLDRELVDQYTLTVVATDGGVATVDRRNTSVNVTIFIMDSNDNPPLPEMFTYVVAIATNHPVLTPVLDVACSDLDMGTNSAIDYSIEPGSIGDLIIQRNGTILLAREQLQQQVYNFNVVCEDRGDPRLASVTQVTVAVETASLTAPVFNQTQYNLSIAETLDTGSPILQLLALSSDPSISILYAIETGNEEELFIIEPLSGVLRVSAQLTPNTEFSLTISATLPVRRATASLANVHITVSDVNNHFPQFSSSFYTANVTEGSIFPTPVVQVSCTDLDPTAQIGYSVNGSLGLFDITDQGLLFVVGSVDFEQQRSHSFEVTCSDGDTQPRVREALIRINVDPLNEFVPTFTQTEYNFNVSENSFGTQIGVLEAVDDDAGSHGDVRYRLQGTSNDSVAILNPISGELTVANDLDFESQQSWDLSVVATDSGDLESHALIRINVLNLNDALPVISPTTIIDTIPSSSPAGFPIRAYSCSDADGYGTDLNIDSGNSLGLFDLDPNNILVWTGLGGSLEANAVISLTLACSDSQLPSQQALGHIAVRIQVTDAVAPVFTEAIYKTNVSEVASVGSDVLTVTAVSQSGNTSYTFFNLPTGFPFEIDSLTGDIALSAALDRERESLYTFFVGATDMGIGVVLVEVLVDDVNDNAPVIIPSAQVVSLPENYPVSGEIIRFMCSDADIGPNGELTFTVASGNTEGKFNLSRVNSQVISIVLGEELDFETETSYQLAIECRDNGPAPKSDRANLTVTVSGVNEFPPLFTAGTYTFLINETASPGDVVGSVVARDSDEGVDGMFLYRIVQAQNHEYFTIDNSGLLHTTQPLNASINNELSILLETTDSGALQDSAIVTVAVLDVNTNPILSDSGVYFVSVTTNQTLNETLLELFCYDTDTGSNADLTLTINYSEFSLSSETIQGRGFVAGSIAQLDSLPPGIYNLPVTCSDDGTPPLSVSAAARVQVRGSNNPPLFDHDHLFISLFEDQFLGIPLTTVNASDSEGNVTYAITDNQGGGFVIHPLTGDISLLLPLDYEMVPLYVLTVTAFDNDVIEPLSASIEVNIDVGNINDERPLLSPPGITQKVVSEGTTLPVETYTCSDPDGSHVTYSISGGLQFSITLGGEVYLSTGFVIDYQNPYVLQVTCQDEAIGNSGITFSSSATLIILVVPANSHAPLFRQPLSLVVPENTPAGDVIGQLNATDLDSRGEITFDLITETELFLIDTLTGEVYLVRELDHESGVTEYNLIVSANDNDEVVSSRSTQANLTITVADVNDNTPFCPSHLIPTLPTGVYSREPFAQLSCSDADSGNNSLLVYTLSRHEGFDVTTNEYGALFISGSFLAPMTVVFDVIVEDSGVPSLQTYTTVALIIESSDANALRFSPDQFSSNFSESTAVSAVIFDGVVFTSALVNPANSTVTYRLQLDLDHSGVFVVDRDSADIILVDNRGIDFESNLTEFMIVVQAFVGLELQASAVLLLDLVDANDNEPEFPQQVFTAEVYENEPPNTIVTQITAVDKDSGQNAILSYSISSSVFAINEFTGNVTTLESFDREIKDQYSMFVTAADLGDPSLSTSVVVLVTILDVNDNPPTLASDLYFKDIDNRSPPNETLLTIEADDNDLNDTLIFELISGDPEILRLFQVEPTGVLRRGSHVIPSNHRSSYRFIVSVSDGVFESNASVVIFIASRTTTAISFTENTAGESYDLEGFLTLQSFVVSNNTTYSIVDGDPDNEFNITSGGVLYTNNLLDRERVENYTLTVTVFDADLDVHLTITVLVKDVNDNPPVFNSTEYLFSINEGPYSGDHLIGNVMATDRDGPGRNSLISYTITGALSGVSSLFRIEKNGDLFIDNGLVLDYELHPNHTLVIRARDDGSSPLFSSTRVVVQLIDVNDNDPEFVPIDVQQYIVLLGKDEIEEDTLLTNLVLILPLGIQRNADRFVFTDRDLISNVSASLIQPAGGHFKLEQNTSNSAFLVANGKLDPLEDKDLMNLQVVITDEPNDPRPVIRNVTLYFEDVVPPTIGPLVPVEPFFETELGIVVIVIVSMLIVGLLFFVLCICCYCCSRLRREKDVKRNRVTTIAQRIETETDRKRKPVRYFDHTDLDRLDFPEYTPGHGKINVLFDPDSDEEYETAFGNAYDPDFGDLDLEQFTPSTNTTGLSSPPAPAADYPSSSSNESSSEAAQVDPATVHYGWGQEQVLIQPGHRKKRRQGREHLAGIENSEYFQY